MYGEKKTDSSAAERIPWRAAARKLIWPSLALLILSTAHAVVAAAQEPLGGMPIRVVSPDDGFSVLDSGLAKRQIMMLNVERQKKLVSDTNKLLKLAAELKSEIDGGGGSAALSPQQMHKLERIEKLAKSVKQEMTQAVGEGPSVVDMLP
jgi:hypothetical protein